jgi:hypothetical protein
MAKSDDHVGKLLDAYRTGDLGETERLWVEGHLETCADCRKELEALGAFARTVERGYAAERAAHAGEREPDWARLRAAIVARTSGRAPRAHRARLGRYVPQAALAVLALVALGVLWEQGIRSPGEAERSLRSERAAGSLPDGARERASEPLGQDRGDRPAEKDPSVANERAQVRVQTDAGPPEESRDEMDDGQRKAALEDRFRQEADAVGREARPDPDRDGAEVPVRDAENQAPAARAEAGRPEGEELEEEVTEAVAAAPPPELERFRRDARSALAQADTLLAAQALTQWQDSLAPRQDLPPEFEQAARALADSLAAFLAARP